MQRQLIFMGTLRPRKGVFELLAAFEVLVKKYPDLHLVYAGIGESLAELQNRIKIAGLQNKIFFPGWVRGAEKISLLQQSTVFILPSYNENFPVSLLEAMSAGIPSVVTKVGGVNDVIQDGNNGLLITPGDVEGIVSKVSQLLDNKELREQVSKNGRDYVKDYCEANFVMSLLEKIYRELNLIKQL
jgi:glycosyltransferase involved in cell wall biosynthesis